jgi:hypothetical protein
LKNNFRHFDGSEALGDLGEAFRRYLDEMEDKNENSGVEGYL